MKGRAVVFGRLSSTSGVGLLITAQAMRFIEGRSTSGKVFQCRVFVVLVSLRSSGPRSHQSSAKRDTVSSATPGRSRSEGMTLSLIHRDRSRVEPSFEHAIDKPLVPVNELGQQSGTAGFGGVLAT